MQALQLHAFLFDPWQRAPMTRLHTGQGRKDISWQTVVLMLSSGLCAALMLPHNWDAALGPPPAPRQLAFVEDGMGASCVAASCIAASIVLTVVKVGAASSCRLGCCSNGLGLGLP